MVDSGSNRNYLSDKHVNLQNCRYTTPTTVRNVKGSHTIHQYVELNPFRSIPNTSKQIFLIFDFHPFFDGLIGYETLKNLNADIITSKNELKFPTGTIKMKRKYPDVRSMHLNAHETKIINLPTKLNGEFLLEDDLFIDKNVTIPSGLYLAENEYARVLVTNHSSEATQVQLNSYTLDPEINNFENHQTPWGNWLKDNPLRPIESRSPQRRRKRETLEGDFSTRRHFLH